MTKRLCILSLFLSIRFIGTGQTNLPTKVCYTHVQSCDYVGTTEEDFIIEFLNDSEIKITRYLNDYKDQYNSVLRLTYNGTYIINNDTIKVKYLAHNTESKNKKKSLNAISFGNPNELPVPYPSSVFIMKDNFIVSADNLFPTLKYSFFSANMVTQLDNKFNDWDKEITHRILF